MMARYWIQDSATVCLSTAVRLLVRVVCFLFSGSCMMHTYHKSVIFIFLFFILFPTAWYAIWMGLGGDLTDKWKYIHTNPYNSAVQYRLQNISTPLGPIFKALTAPRQRAREDQMVRFWKALDEEVLMPPLVASSLCRFYCRVINLWILAPCGCDIMCNLRLYRCMHLRPKFVTLPFFFFLVFFFANRGIFLVWGSALLWQRATHVRHDELIW